MELNCVLCRGTDGDAELERVQVWEDDHWRLTFSLTAEVLGFCYLEPKRHIPSITELDGEEAQTLGKVLALAARILKEETGTEGIYIYLFGDSVPHLHFHLAPHRAGDALSDQMIRGEIVSEKMAGGTERLISRQFPPLPEQEQRAAAERVQNRLKTE